MSTDNFVVSASAEIPLNPPLTRGRQDKSFERKDLRHPLVKGERGDLYMLPHKNCQRTK